MKALKILIASMLILASALGTTKSLASELNPAPLLIPSSGEVVSAINQYRQQNGLTLLASNSLLASLAQGQSDYQAAIGSITHTGPGGTTPQQRAANAGYGGGNFFYLSEIIYGGTNATTADAVAWWKNSGLHNSIMLDSRYTEIGAGIATDGTRVYFTAMLGGPTSGTSGSTPETGEGGSPTENSPSQPTAVAAIPVLKSTPSEDGSIIHIVSQGQSLWTIAAVYEIELDELLEINDLTRNSFVFPGDSILIQPPVGTPTPTIEPTSTQTPTSTSEPERSADKVLGTPYYLSLADDPTPEVQAQPAEPVSPSPANLSNSRIVPTLVISAIIILVLSIFLSNFLQQQTGRKNKDDLPE